VRGAPSSLWVYRGLVIEYDAMSGRTHQPLHRDASLLSCVVPLSELGEYEGGGTYIEPLGSVGEVNPLYPQDSREY
jgi:hypothetical protein